MISVFLIDKSAVPLQRFIRPHTDAEERYIKSDWYFDSNLYLRRIEIPGGEVGRPAKIITQSPDNIDQLEIFGQQDYIQTSKPESMSCKEIYRWSDWERQNMK